MKLAQAYRQSTNLRKKRYKVNLPEQLAQCEFNYRRLSRLLPNLPLLAVGQQRQLIVGSYNAPESLVSFTIVEQTKYTSVVHIVQTPPLQKQYTSIKNVPKEKKGVLRPLCGDKRQYLPCVVYRSDVRLYHDATMAEVVKCQRYRFFEPRYEYPNLDMHQVDEKAQMNRFLGELLTHCHSHGRVADNIAAHIFPRQDNKQS